MSAPVSAGQALDGVVLQPVSDWRTPSADEAKALAVRIAAAHDELVAGLRTTVDKAADLGVLLTDLKPRFRGEWLHWLERHTPVRRRMAAIYMGLARARAEHDRRQWKRISNLGIAGALADLRSRRRQAATLTRPSPTTSILPTPNVRVAGDRDQDLVLQVCSLLHRLRELSGKISGFDLYAKVTDKLRNDFDLSLLPAAGFMGDLLQAHAQAQVRAAKALAEQHGIEIDEVTERSFEAVLQGSAR